MLGVCIKKVQMVVYVWFVGRCVERVGGAISCERVLRRWIYRYIG